MTAWAILNTSSALFAAVVIVFMVGRFHEDLSSLERAGWCSAAAGLTMRIGPIIGKSWGTPSPFDDWSVTFLHLGLATAALGWVLRKRYRLAHE